MAKKLYEEENIRAIANKIRQFAWNKSATYTTKEMPGAIESACQNEYEDGYSNGWDLGWDDGWQEGFEEGYHQGKAEGGGGELHHLLYEQIQSQEVIYMSKYQFCYPLNIYGSSIDYNFTFDDYADREYSSISSNPLTYSVDNYTDFYLYIYIRATDIANDEGYLAELAVPPHWNNSVDFISKISKGTPVEWRTELIGARFVIDEI